MVMTMQCLRDEEFAEGIQRNRNVSYCHCHGTFSSFSNYCVFVFCVLWFVQSSGRRTSNGILTNALEVYVNDPVVDWLKAPLAKEVLCTHTHANTLNNM